KAAAAARERLLLRSDGGDRNPFGQKDFRAERGGASSLPATRLAVRALSSAAMAEPGGQVSFDTSVPNVARIYDYWLGGKDNFAADREAAERSAKAVPQLPWLSRENRKFLGRAVRFCAAAGITQFLDIGSGLPTMENVHEVAEQVITRPHVV